MEEELHKGCWKRERKLEIFIFSLKAQLKIDRRDYSVNSWIFSKSFLELMLNDPRAEFDFSRLNDRKGRRGKNLYNPSNHGNIKVDENPFGANYFSGGDFR